MHSSSITNESKTNTRTHTSKQAQSMSMYQHSISVSSIGSQSNSGGHDDGIDGSWCHCNATWSFLLSSSSVCAMKTHFVALVFGLGLISGKSNNQKSLCCVIYFRWRQITVADFHITSHIHSTSYAPWILRRWTQHTLTYTHSYYHRWEKSAEIKI